MPAAEVVVDLAHRSAAPWRGHRDHVDLVQEACLGILRAGDRDDAGLVWAGRCRVIDYLRRNGAVRGRRKVRVRPSALLSGDESYDGDEKPLDPHIDAHLKLMAARDPAPPMSVEWGLTGRSALIADMLAAGHDKTTIARELGVSPGRVSQLLRPLRAAAPT